jgi:nicotinamidase-related amidase
MDLYKHDTAVLVTDLQNDFLSEKGVAWLLVSASVKENNTAENIERLFKAAKNNEEVFISSHYYYLTDRAWRFGGTGERMMHETKLFDRSGSLSPEGFRWLERYKPFIENGKTVMVSPHKVHGPENNDRVLQTRKRRISKVMLAGMSANLRVEAHLRELVEQGFEVAVVKDAMADPWHPELGDGDQAALVNFGFIASAVLSTDEAVEAMR